MDTAWIIPIGLGAGWFAARVSAGVRLGFGGDLLAGVGGALLSGFLIARSCGPQAVA